MVTASAANIFYYHPYQKDGELYISGDNVAKMPAMYAALAAMEKHEATQTKLRVISVGGVRETPDAIKKNAGLLVWAERLTTLYQESKYHTMDYFTETMLQQKGHHYKDFNLLQSRNQIKAMYYADERLEKLQHLAQEMIFSKSVEISDILEDIVLEKFTCKLTSKSE